MSCHSWCKLQMAVLLLPSAPPSSIRLQGSTSADGNVGGSMKLPCGLCAEVPLCALLASAWRAPIRMLTL
eukprot:CAMPEP_0115496020 /NCGR_PEP_ID=MMETSP0271-20121206/65554_1 /TAXON_ID=71861 /ORGANISM="Scrippsiella trochoidea, Strain CCMP3099" /LENGTH=69 /DNA_ID=CAMNT_0002924685 /DNA_START=563 /DNA_END=772 /DNA_ORIENTATION=+